MLDERAKEAINLLRNHRQKGIQPIGQPASEALPVAQLQPLPIPPSVVQPSSGLFVFERTFEISNCQLKLPKVWEAVVFRQGKATFDRLKLPTRFRPVTCAVLASVVSGFGAPTELSLQIVRASLLDTKLIQNPDYHLLTNDVTFDGHANPIRFLKVSTATQGVDVLVKGEDFCKEDVRLTVEVVELGDCVVTFSMGQVKCLVPKGTTCGGLVEAVATSEAAKYLRLKVISDPGVLVDLSADLKVVFQPNNQLSLCRAVDIQPHEGIAVIGQMLTLDHTIEYQCQLYVVCTLF